MEDTFIKKLLKHILVFILLVFVSGCQADFANHKAETNDHAQIYLYGEEYGMEEDTNKEFILWKDFYDKDGMRNLFLEVPNYVAGYLNLWMKEDDDQILEILRNQYKFAQGNKLKHYGKLLRLIKTQCPETVFYGTDMSISTERLGKEYLDYVEKNKDTRQIDRVKEVMAQGQTMASYINEYRARQTDKNLASVADYRENMLVENFIYEFENLEDKRIMGIYGAYHVANPHGLELGKAPIMGEKIKDHYGHIVSINILADINLDK